jgi:hypothetical protein
MSARKPSLDWIKEVLADSESENDAGLLPIGIVLERESADDRSAHDRASHDGPPSPDRDNRLLRPSWPRMRLAATQKS